MDAENSLTTTWREAEHSAAAHMRSLGFTDAEVTPLGVDGGGDVLTGGAIAEDLWRTRKVGENPGLRGESEQQR